MHVQRAQYGGKLEKFVGESLWLVGLIFFQLCCTSSFRPPVNPSSQASVTTRPPCAPHGQSVTNSRKLASPFDRQRGDNSALLRWLISPVQRVVTAITPPKQELTLRFPSPTPSPTPDASISTCTTSFPFSVLQAPEPRRHTIHTIGH